ncbi:MAG: hypothetical protein ABSG11_24645 [Candidatus Korobacteraceae bacterium]
MGRVTRDGTRWSCFSTFPRAFSATAYLWRKVDCKRLRKILFRREGWATKWLENLAENGSLGAKRFGKIDACVKRRGDIAIALSLHTLLNCLQLACSQIQQGSEPVFRSLIRVFDAIHPNVAKERKPHRPTPVDNHQQCIVNTLVHARLRKRTTRSSALHPNGIYHVRFYFRQVSRDVLG